MKYHILYKGWSGVNWRSPDIGELKDIQIKYEKNYNELLYHLLELLFNDNYGFLYRISREDGQVMFESDISYDFYDGSIMDKIINNQTLTFKHIMLLLEKYGEDILRIFKGNKEVIEYLYNKYKK